jgi:hypothetical protein
MRDGHPPGERAGSPGPQRLAEAPALLERGRTVRRTPQLVPTVPRPSAPARRPGRATRRDHSGRQRPGYLGAADPRTTRCPQAGRRRGPLLRRPSGGGPGDPLAAAGGRPRLGADRDPAGDAGRRPAHDGTRGLGRVAGARAHGERRRRVRYASLRRPRDPLVVLDRAWVVLFVLRLGVDLTA